MDIAAEKLAEQEKKEKERSYLSAAVESISPWGTSRTSTPKPKEKEKSEGSGLKNQHGGDHSTSYWKGLSRRRYPPDCPELNARWFYAVDVSLLLVCEGRGLKLMDCRFQRGNRSFLRATMRTPNHCLHQRNSPPSLSTIPDLLRQPIRNWQMNMMIRVKTRVRKILDYHGLCQVRGRRTTRA